MSHHYSGPALGFSHGNAHLDLTDLYAFGKPGDDCKSILIMNHLNKGLEHKKQEPSTPNRGRPMSKPFLLPFLYLPLMVWLSSNVQAADQATLDKLVGYAKDACLVGIHVELHADVSGNITVRNSLQTGR